MKPSIKLIGIFLYSCLFIFLLSCTNEDEKVDPIEKYSGWEIVEIDQLLFRQPLRSKGGSNTDVFLVTFKNGRTFKKKIPIYRYDIKPYRSGDKVK